MHSRLPLFAALVLLAGVPAHADQLPPAPPAAEADADTASYRTEPAEPAQESAEPVEELPALDAARSGACTVGERETLRALGREFALRLVSEDFLGGQDVEHLVENCTFDGTHYEGILHVRWRGALLGWNDYNVWGRLRTTPDGAEATFSPRGASESVQSLRFWGNLGNIGMSLVR